MSQVTRPTAAPITILRVPQTRFGEIEVEADKLIHLEGGLLGFPGLSDYVILDHGRESPFKWLQSTQEGPLCFVVIDPFIFQPAYSVELSEAEVAQLEIEDPSDVALAVIVTVPEDYFQMTANLQGPIVINTRTRKGRQLVLAEGRYTTRHLIADELRKNLTVKAAGGEATGPTGKLPSSTVK